MRFFKFFQKRERGVITARQLLDIAAALRRRAVVLEIRASMVNARNG